LFEHSNNTDVSGSSETTAAKYERNAGASARELLDQVFF
jgi:hypothetical protein